MTDKTTTPAPPKPRVEQGSRYDPNYGRTSAQEVWKDKMPKQPVSGQTATKATRQRP
jgi:hypothetical protein